MWDWDPSQGEATSPGGSTPRLLSEDHKSSQSSAQPQPVVIPHVQELKQQFQQQQAFLAQIKETLLENDADRTNKEKQLEMYTKKLHQIKNRTKSVIGKEGTTSSNTSPLPSPQPVAPPGTRPVESKMSELKRRLEENKIKFEERAEKELADTNKIKSMVEHLRTQVQERDITIHEIQKTMDTPPARPRPKVQTLPKRYKDRPVILSKWTQTVNTEKDINKKQAELEATIVDLEDTIKQQASVIEARTQAITLLSDDMSRKGKTTLDDLEDTRKEMREMQANFVLIENQFKAQLLEKDARLSSFEDTMKTLEETNKLLTASQKKTEEQLQETCAENETLRSSAQPAVHTQDAIVVDLEKKVAKLEKELDESNKLMIRLRLEQKKAGKKGQVKQSTDAIPRELQDKLDELEKCNSTLTNKIVDMEDEKAAHSTKLVELEQTISQKENEIQTLREAHGALEIERNSLLMSLEDQNIVIDNLNARIENMEAGDTGAIFSIPGDEASLMLATSNDAVQSQIEKLVSEKQELLMQLKSSVSAAKPAEEKKAVDLPPTTSSDVLISLETDLAVERLKVSELETQVQNLEKQVSQAEGPSMGTNTLKNKLKKVIAELKKDKKRIEELQSELRLKSEENSELTLKLVNFERRRQDSVSSLGEPDVTEIQQKYLTMEGDMLQLNEKYEHLRKENIEMVHQLSGEKVRRLQAEEELNHSWKLARELEGFANLLDARIQSLESSPKMSEYANIVIASNDTEIFNLQRALANKTQELELLSEQYESSNRVLQNQLQEQCERERKLLNEREEDLLRTINARQLEIQELSKSLAVVETERVKLISELNNKLHLDGIVKQLQTALDGQTEEITKREAHLQKLSHENTELRTQLDGESAQLNERIHALGTENSKLKEELHRIQVSMESVLLESAQERHRAEERQQLLEDTRLKYEEAEKVLAKTWAEKNDLIQSREGVVVKLRQLEGECSKIMQERDAAVTQYYGVCEQLTLVNNQVQELQGEVQKKAQEATDKHTELESMTAKAKKLAANLKKKAQAETDLIGQLKSQTALNEQLETELLERRQSSSERESVDLLNRLENVEKEKIELNEQVEGLLTEMQALVEQLNLTTTEKEVTSQYLADKETEINHLRNELNTLNSEKVELLASFKQLHEGSIASNCQIDGLLAENGSLQRKLNDIEEKWTHELSEKEALQLLHDDACKRLTGLEQAFEMEQKENEMLTSQRSLTLKDIEELKEKCLEADLVRSKAEEKNTELEGRIAELQASLSKVEVDDHSKSEIIQKEKSELELLLSSRNTAMDEANLMISQLQSSMFTLQSDKEALEASLQQLMIEKSELESHLQTEREALHAANLKIAESDAKILDLEAEKKNLSEAMTRIEDETNTEINDYDIQVANLQKQVNNFNVAFEAEVQKNSALKSEVESLNAYIQRLQDDVKSLGKGEKQEKKRKSVTFTEEADYIKELRGEVTSLQKALVESDATMGELKAALVEKNEKGTEAAALPSFQLGLFEKPPAGDFLTESADPADPFAAADSLQWDDSWGAEGQLEADHIFSKASQEAPEKVQKLECELKAVYSEKEKMQEEFRVLQVKYSKVVKKLKEQKLTIDQLQSEVKNAKMIGSGFGDLDAAIVDELKTELSKAEAREGEVRKELENLNKEKESLLKRIDMLNAGNERFVEMKERQDNDAAVWQNRCTELREEVTQLKEQLQAPLDDNIIAQENRELKNLIEGLEWKVSELTEMMEEGEEKLAMMSSKQPSDSVDTSGEIQEVTKKLEDAESQLTLLAAENETLQSILNEQKLTSSKFAETSSSKTTLAQWFTSDPQQDDPFNVQPSSAPPSASYAEEIKQLKDELNSKNQEIEAISRELSEAIQEKDKLLGVLRQREEEVQELQIRLQHISRDYEESKLEIERLLNDNRASTMPNELQAREEEIIALQLKVDQLQQAYAESKLEIDRLLTEVGMTENIDEAIQTKNALESEKARYESIIQLKDSEINKLRHEIGSYDREYEEAQGKSNESVLVLKSQLRELEAASSRLAEEKDLELGELRAECCELRELLTTRQLETEKLRADLNAVENAVRQQDESRQVQEVTEEMYEQLRQEYSKALDLLGEKTSQLAQVQPSLNQKETELLGLRQELKSFQQRFTARESELAQEFASLEADFLARDAEVRELRAERLDLEEELRELQSQSLTQQQESTTKPVKVSEVQHDRSGNELAALLQSDLDTALYRLHQRDVRCDELTFELTQLLEERDALQLRLSTVIRQNEEMRQPNVPSGAASDSRQGLLENKISEIHKVGYIRDKNIQDESQQRHREQMAFVTRQANPNVFDI